MQEHDFYWYVGGAAAGALASDAGTAMVWAGG